MPEHASTRFAAGLFDQQSEEHRIADWGGDELFTRMPRPRRVDDAPAPRFRPSLMVLDAPQERRRSAPGEEWQGPHDRRRAVAAPAPPSPQQPRPTLELVEDGWDRAGERPTKTITGRPDRPARASAATASAARRHRPRTPADLVGPRPERIMAWAFALGLLLILVAISTADAATL